MVIKKAEKIEKKSVNKKEKTSVKNKSVAKKTVAVKKTAQKVKYWKAVGRRKTAVARVRIFSKGNKEFIVDEKDIKERIKTLFLRKIARSPLEILNLTDKFHVSVKLSGGGSNAQAEAIRHGLSRALIEFNPNFRKKLKKAGFLTRDSRMKERKKFGLKKARRAPQWQKR
ncbi:MAG: 30S ribosomal protein S9 [Candidatus Pacebacteria bacterium]|nr:30S ribosomal protein S9 [Candidatus Paceibacterota bacterium]